ncbi:MAG: integrin alpha, partial [Pseudomonadota bacterium]
MSDYAGVTLTGTYGEALGSTSAIIGDINGDGFADFAVSAAPAYFGELGGAGGVYIVFGSDDLPRTLNISEIDGTNGFRIDADYNLGSPYYGFGYSSFGSDIVGLGDVNGDGVDDFAIAQISSNNGFYGPQQGVAYIVLGGQDFGDTAVVSEIADYRIDTPGIVGEVIALGDINGDGFADVGVITADLSAQNYVYADFNYLSDLNGNGVYDEFEEDGETRTGEFQYTGEIVLRRGETTGYVIFGTDQ